VSGTTSKRRGRLGVALAVVLFGGAEYQATSLAADPGNDEIEQLLTPKDGDVPATRHFKETGKNPYNKNPEAIAAGFKLARAVACTHCHGSDLSGLIGPNLTSGNWRHPRNGTDRGLFQTLYFGTNAGMAAWGNLGSLTEDEILKVMAFVRSKYRGDPAGNTWE
jgi:cytochrome c-L